MCPISLTRTCLVWWSSQGKLIINHFNSRSNSSILYNLFHQLFIILLNLIFGLHLGLAYRSLASNGIKHKFLLLCLNYSCYWRWHDFFRWKSIRAFRGMNNWLVIKASPSILETTCHRCGASFLFLVWVWSLTLSSANINPLIILCAQKLRYRLLRRETERISLVESFLRLEALDYEIFVNPPSWWSIFIRSFHPHDLV